MHWHRPCWLYGKGSLGASYCSAARRHSEFSGSIALHICAADQLQTPAVRTCTHRQHLQAYTHAGMSERHRLSTAAAVMFLKTSGIWSKQSTTTLMQWISFGDYTEAVSRIKEAGIPVMVMVQSVEEAVRAASLGASAVVAQVDYSHYHQPMSLQASADPYLQSLCGAF